MINFLQRMAASFLMIGMLIPSVCYSNGWNNDRVQKHLSHINLENAYQEIHQIMLIKYNEAREAYYNSGPKAFSESLGYTGVDLDYLMRKITKSGLPDLPSATLENGRLVFEHKTEKASFQIKDFHMRQVAINGKTYNFTLGESLSKSFGQNVVSMKALFSQEMSWSNKILEFFIPSAHAGLGDVLKWGAIIAVGAIAISALSGAMFGEGKKFRDRIGDGAQNGIDLIRAPFKFRDENGKGYGLGGYLNNLGNATGDAVFGRTGSKEKHHHGQKSRKK